MALDAIPQPPLKIVSLEDAVIHLADEGVPVRAIARATRTPSEEVYELLKEAVDEGTLVELPQADWPPSSLRRSRKPSAQSVLNLKDDVLQLTSQKLFKLTRQQAAVFVAILRRAPEIHKSHIQTAIESTRPPNEPPTDQKMIDVIIHHIRKKTEGYGIELTTKWGTGYSLPYAQRDKVLEMFTQYLRPPQAA